MAVRELVAAGNLSKAFTVSVGKLQEKSSKKKHACGIGVMTEITLPGEKKRMEMVSKILNKKPLIGIEEAMQKA